MSNPKRLHPAAMILNAIASLRQFIFAALPIIILVAGDGHLFYIGIGVAVLALLLIGYGILAWFKYTYVVEGDQLKIEHGVIIKKKRTISKNRIQSIDLTQGIIHRIFGLTKVQIETAGSDRNIDAALSAVTFDEGRRLHQELKQTIETASDEEEDLAEEKADVFRSITIQNLLIAGSTSGGFGVVLGLVAVVFSELESFIPETVYQQTTMWVVNQAIEIIIVLSVLLVILLWILGILGTVIKYGKFTIIRYPHELYITRGLLEKRQMTIPLKRIQAVGVKESIIRQPLGFATVFVEIAGGVKEQEKNTETLIFPLIKKKEINDFLKEILPEYQHVPTSYTRVPTRAIPYYLFRTAIIPVLGLIVVAILFPEWVIIPIIITLLFTLFGIIRHRTTGFHLTEDRLTLQLRLFNKETVMLKRGRVQSISKKQHIVHRKQQLANLNTSILNNFGGKHYQMSELEETDVDNIADWFSYRTMDKME